MALNLKKYQDLGKHYNNRQYDDYSQLKDEDLFLKQTFSR